MTKKTDVVDLKDLYELSRGNNEFIKEMIEIFLEQNPADLSEIEMAITGNDFSTIKATAHRMKTSLGFMGMKHLLGTLSEMEQLAENKRNMQKIAANYEDIKINCEAATKELITLLKKIEKGEGL